jgi:anti-anti-sigma factor
MSRFHIQTLVHPGYAVLRTEGEVDQEAAHAIEDEYDRLARSGRRDFVFNFARAGIIDSRGLAVLLGIVERHGEALGGRILFCELGEVNAEQVEAAGLPPGARCVATEAEARALLEGPPAPSSSSEL